MKKGISRQIQLPAIANLYKKSVGFFVFPLSQGGSQNIMPLQVWNLNNSSRYLLAYEE